MSAPIPGELRGCGVTLPGTRNPGAVGQTARGMADNGGVDVPDASPTAVTLSRKDNAIMILVASPEGDPDDSLITELQDHDGLDVETYRVQLAGPEAIQAVVTAAEGLAGAGGLTAVAVVVRAWIYRHQHKSVTIEIPGKGSIQLTGEPLSDERLRELTAHLEDPTRAEGEQDDGR